MLLSETELIAPFTDLRLVSLFEIHDEIVRARIAGGGFDLGLSGIKSPVADVVGDGAAEQMRLLQYDSQVRLQPL